MEGSIETKLAAMMDARVSALETKLEAKLDRILALLEPSPAGNAPPGAKSKFASKLRSEVLTKRTSFKDDPAVLEEERAQYVAEKWTLAVKYGKEETKEESKKPEVPVEPVPPPHWADVVPVPEAYTERGSTIEKTEFRAISILQLNELAKLVKNVVGRVEIPDAYREGARVTWDLINLYIICHHFVMPLTGKFQCSFAELVAPKEQIPKWFVSHWWGTPFEQTVKLLTFHAETRRLPHTTFYWICTFANNQHNLAELGGGLQETPFVKAIMHPDCVGTVATMDKDVTTFKRIWCVLENYVSTVETARQGKAHYYDLAAWLPDAVQTFEDEDVPACPTLQLDRGGGVFEEAGKVEGASFPLDVAEKGVKLDICAAAASRAEDQRAILNFIAGGDAGAGGPEPPASHANFDALNHRARERFAGGALYRATYRGNLATVQSLLAAYPAVVNAADSFGTTALFCAAWQGQSDILNALIAGKANLDSVDKDGASPCFVSAEHGHAKELQALIEAGADFSKPKLSGTPPLAMAAQNGEIETVQILIEAKADINSPMADGTTPICIAAYGGHADVVKVLIEVNADINKPDNDGGTPLYCAAENGHPEVVKVLVDGGADAKKKCCGKTPLQVAKSNRYPKVVAILKGL